MAQNRIIYIAMIHEKGAITILNPIPYISNINFKIFMFQAVEL